MGPNRIIMNYSKFFDTLKEQLINHIEENKSRYLSHEQIQFEKNNKHDDVLESYYLARNERQNKKIKRQKPPSQAEIEEWKELFSDITKGVDKKDINAFFSQYIHQVINHIRVSSSIEM